MLLVLVMQAFHWYNTWAAFQKVIPHKTYAQALLTNTDKKVFTRDATNVLLTSATKIHNFKVRPRAFHLNEHPLHVNTVKNYHANTGPRKSMVPNKSNVPVPLHNRFQVLNNFDAEREAVQTGIMQCDSNVETTDTYMVVAGAKRLEEHSQECKHPSLLGVLQPCRNDQQNSYFSGNKNKTGSFGMGNICTKYSSDDSLSQDSSDSACPEKIAGIIVPSVNNCDKNTVVAISSQDAGIQTQPQLADLKHYFSGNKNKTGSFDGDSYANTREIFDNHVRNGDHKFEHCGDALNVIDTVISDLELYQNCSHNKTDHTQSLDNTGGLKIVNDLPDATFGFIPTGPLKIYDGTSVSWNPIPDIITAHLLVKNSGLPNYLGCHIPVHSNLHCDNWDYYLQHYWDNQLVDLFKYGFPLDFDRSSQLVSTEENHKSASINSIHIQKYISEELSHGAILGSFKDKPISLHTSPLMVRDKQDSSAKRTIMDLSWPHGLSVNQGVSKYMFLDTEFQLKYPSVDQITSSLRNLGPAAMIYKIDISRAFRQIKVDPGDIDLLGFKFQNDYFLDLSVAFGYRNGSQIFQRCTDAIRFNMAQHGFPYLYNYIDDLIYTGLPSEIHKSDTFFTELLGKLGLVISVKKLIPPVPLLHVLAYKLTLLIEPYPSHLTNSKKL